MQAARSDAAQLEGADGVPSVGGDGALVQVVGAVVAAAPEAACLSRRGATLRVAAFSNADSSHIEETAANLTLTWNKSSTGTWYILRSSRTSGPQKS